VYSFPFAPTDVTYIGGGSEFRCMRVGSIHARPPTVANQSRPSVPSMAVDVATCCIAPAGHRQNRKVRTVLCGRSRGVLPESHLRESESRPGLRQATQIHPRFRRDRPLGQRLIDVILFRFQLANECSLPRARDAAAACSWPGRTIPSFLIRNWRVDRFIASRAAAPLGPLRTQ